jgi:cobalt-zinc-cadmium efflux system membrane fusion protein
MKIQGTYRRIYRVSMMFGISAGLMLSGCKHADDPDVPEQPKANLKVDTVHLQNVADSLEIPGRVEADPAHVVHIYAPLSGRLMNLNLTPGQEVHKGQVIATLQSGDVAQARSDFEKAHIEAVRADAALERGKQLVAHEVMSQADFLELKAVDDAAHSEQERARQRIHELGFSESGTTDITSITAPITGTVTDVGTASGEMQRSLETANGIATVANLDTVWVTGDLFEQDLGIVHPHEAVDLTFAAYPGEVFHGSIANIGDSLDPTTHAVKARVVLNNPGHRLKPAMFATLRIVKPEEMRIMLPVEAVLYDGANTEVYVPAADGKYEVRPVKVGDTLGKQIEILSGLQDGDRVVTQGAAYLREPAGD